MIIELVLVSVFFLVLASWKIHKDNKDLPPGPFGMPLFGHLLLLGIKPHVTLQEWKKKYGPILFCRFGFLDFGFPAVVIQDPKLVRQLFTMQETSGRPDLPVFVHGSQEKGIIFNYGPGNMEQRQFALRNLRDFGMGKKTMEGAIQEDLLQLLDKLKEKEGSPVSNVQLFNSHLLNSLWTIVMGERMDQQILQDIGIVVREKLNHMGSPLRQLAYFMPWMDSFAKCLTFGQISFLQHKIGTYRKLYHLMGKLVEEQEATRIKDQPRHITDVYLDKVGEETNPKSSFHKKNFWAGHFVFDLFQGGIETTSTSLEWLLNYMARYPEVQKKLQNEIDQVVGNSRLPTLEDRPQMPYADAVMYELLRLSSIVSLAIPHKTFTDLSFHGYRIPKDTMIIANTYAIHNDPEVFPEPGIFRPERWLTSEAANLKNNHFLPFSIGKRNCVGEILARQQLFLYITTIFQRFNVEFAGKTPITDSIAAIVLQPSDFEVYFHSRI